MGRHRHAVSVREDGLAAVLGALLDDRAVTAAALVDLDSGMVLDGCCAPPGPASRAPVELDLLGAGHAELVRVAAGVLADGAAINAVSDVELVLSCRGDLHHLLLGVADPFGDGVALSVVVTGSVRHLERVRRRLRTVSRSALTAGPTVSRRPAEHGWRLGLAERPAPRSSARSRASGTAVSASAAWPGPVRERALAAPPPPTRTAGDEHPGHPAPPAALPPAAPRSP